MVPWETFVSPSLTSVTRAIAEVKTDKDERKVPAPIYNGEVANPIYNPTDSPGDVRIRILHTSSSSITIHIATLSELDPASFAFKLYHLFSTSNSHHKPKAMATSTSTFDPTYKPTFSELKNWHDEKTEGNTVPPSMTWEEAMKTFVLRKMDDLVELSWPSCWIFPQSNISDEEMALLFDDEHKKMAYRVGYTYGVLHRYLKRLSVESHAVNWEDDPFLYGMNAHSQILDFLGMVNGRLGRVAGAENLDWSTVDRAQLLRQNFAGSNPPAEDYMYPGDNLHAFEDGLDQAEEDLREAEELEKLKEPTKTEELGKFSITDYKEPEKTQQA